MNYCMTNTLFLYMRLPLQYLVHHVNYIFFKTKHYYLFHKILWRGPEPKCVFVNSVKIKSYSMTSNQYFNVLDLIWFTNAIIVHWRNLNFRSNFGWKCWQPILNVDDHLKQLDCFNRLWQMCPLHDENILNSVKPKFICSQYIMPQPIFEFRAQKSRHITLLTKQGQSGGDPLCPKVLTFRAYRTFNDIPHTYLIWWRYRLTLAIISASNTFALIFTGLTRSAS